MAEISVRVCPICRKHHAREQACPPASPTSRHCLQCGQAFIARNNRKTWCSATCAKQWWTPRQVPVIKPVVLPRPVRYVDEPLVTIYFVQVDAFIKIGVATDITRRLRSLESQCPLPIRCLGIIPNEGRQLEQSLHERFHVFRHRYEWFHAVPDIYDYIQQHTIPFNGVTAQSAVS